MGTHAHSPAAPDCTLLVDGVCTCEEYYGINGDETDKARAIAIAVRQDGKTQTARAGRGPDTDEATDPHRAGIRQQGDTMRGQKPDGHFWKRSEFLKCNAGIPMVSDKRGLPPGYMTSENWQRAKESQS